ncbi:MAG: MBL fold metallo-hydrolase [Actinobacteria bacterium]|nr:MBL fold metallo-hydrolase [Actinomycetota bacterium]
MRIIGTGHAGLRIETSAGAILCDPWVNPAYFASWFPFPDNSGLDWDALGRTEFLFVSHLHRDHCDPALLARHVDKAATVLLPEFPTDELERELRSLGFTSFLRTRADEVVDLGSGVRALVQALTSPTDGPIGDSSLWVEDGGVRLFNQNDARPGDLAAIRELGHVHAQLLQFSGAIWYPMVYEQGARAKAALGRQKRDRQLDRTVRYIDELGADWVVPIAGPPCFLDEELWDLNDIVDDAANIFPDQSVFLDHLRSLGRSNGVLLLPGSVVDLTAETCQVDHRHLQPADVFDRKLEHLEAYAARQRRVIEAAKASWSHPEIDVLDGLRTRLQPLLDEADHIATGIGAPVLLELLADDDLPLARRGEDVEPVERVVIDFPGRTVRRPVDADAHAVRYRFRFERRLVEQLLADGAIDWVNSLFLSCRFSAKRTGQYNEFVYTFFKCLSEERLQYAEGWYDEQEPDAEDIEIDGWVVQRRCPHLKADLARFGHVTGTVLTCDLHGWRFDLDQGTCITSVGHPIRAHRARGDAEAAAG